MPMLLCPVNDGLNQFSIGPPLETVPRCRYVRLKAGPAQCLGPAAEVSFDR
jgi:hypothetical protein